MFMSTAIPSQAPPANQARLPRFSCMRPAFFIHPSHPIRTDPAQPAHPSHPSHRIDGISFPIMKFRNNSVLTQQLWLSNTETHSSPSYTYPARLRLSNLTAISSLSMHLYAQAASETSILLPACHHAGHLRHRRRRGLCPHRRLSHIGLH